MAPVRLTLLGGFQARLASGDPVRLPTKKAQALLAYLALRPGHGHLRDKLAALLWGETADEQARSSLRQTLFTLRKTLPVTTPPILMVEGETLALNPSAVEVDAAAFEHLVSEGTPDALEHAAALYQGDLLEGFSLREAPFEEWLMAERERLRELALHALEKLLAHQGQIGETEQAIRTAQRLLVFDPTRESVHRTLMRLYARQNRWSAALRQYQMCVNFLQRELGVEPDTETKNAYQELLRTRTSPPSRTEGPPTRRPSRPRLAAGPTRHEARIHDTALIGREGELGQLRETLREARHGGRRVVMVLGEAGIGKSRLIEELATEAREQGGRVLLGRSYESEQILSFGPWADAMRIGQVLDEGELMAKLGPVWLTELARLFPELAEAGLQPPTDAADHLRLFEAMARLIEHFASEQPLLLILEDLHWADEMSLRLLHFLGRRIEGWRVLLMGTAREEEIEEIPMLRHIVQELRREQRLLEISLLPLSQPDTATLVRALVKAGTDKSTVTRLQTQVWRMSEGNPLMVVETLRAGQEGSETLTSTALLPERVRQVIGGRLERLGERGQEFVAVAAVIGRDFEFPLLHQASGRDEREAAEGVEELVRRRVLREVGNRFAFTHDRVRQVAYDRLLPARRKLLHRRVAEALEAHYANLEPHYAALGLHYNEGEAWEKALSYLRLAGAQAGGRAAYREAALCFERALVTFGHLPKSPGTMEQAIELRFDLRNSLWPLGDFAPMLEHLREAEALAERLGDHARLGRAFSFMTQYFSMVGEPDRAIDCGQRALALAEALGDVGLEVSTTLHLGGAYYARGEYRHATVLLKKNSDLLQGDLARKRFGHTALPAVYSRTWLAWSLAELGDLVEGFNWARQGLSLAEEADHPLSVTSACLGVGMVCLRQGEFPKAISACDRALRLSERWDFAFWLAAAAGLLGYAHVLSGRVAEALPLLEQAVERTAATIKRVDYAPHVTWLSEAYLEAGRTDEAFRNAERALELARKHGERGHEAWSLRLLAEIHARRDPPEVDKAEDFYREAAERARQLEMRPLLAHCHLGLGLVYRRRGGLLQQARQGLSAAVDLFLSMEMGPWLARAADELAKTE